MKFCHCKLVLAFLFMMTCNACSLSEISATQYIDAMVALGCKGLQEGNAAASEVLKQSGVSEDQIVSFRKKADFKTMTDAANEIARRVIACHGVDQ